MKGLVIKNTGSWYTVLTDDGQTVDCKIKGNFRLKGIRSTNPVAVGDRVTISPAGFQSASRVQGSNAASQRSKVQSPTDVQRVAGGSEVAFITGIEDRKNYIIRKSSNLSKQSHIIAANVDQAFLIVTVNYPETSTTFIDRFLASAEAYSVPVVLVFNKLDLLNDDDRHIQQMLITLYENIGYPCVEVSAQTGEGIDRLFELLQGKITLLSGNSGVGKSTLINRLVPGVNLRTAEISDAHKTGMHTTTFSEMINLSPALPEGEGASPTPNPSPVGRGTSWLIDTPGIKGFGTFDMEPEELTSYFREIFHFSKGCRFNNCTHTHEPGCAVLKALEDHYIAQSRYQSYLSMMEDKEDGKYRAAY
ncbi:MAG: ribosome small subunit-dependent GTPase A [Prevotella sp.]|nr:ribosome small subunit-dependent GTPase A [Prevotella sp.]